MSDPLLDAFAKTAQNMADGKVVSQAERDHVTGLTGLMVVELHNKMLTPEQISSRIVDGAVSEIAKHKRDCQGNIPTTPKQALMMMSVKAPWAVVVFGVFWLLTRPNALPAWLGLVK